MRSCSSLLSVSFYSLNAYYLFLHNLLLILDIQPKPTDAGSGSAGADFNLFNLMSQSKLHFILASAEYTESIVYSSRRFPNSRANLPTRCWPRCARSQHVCNVGQSVETSGSWSTSALAYGSGLSTSCSCIRESNEAPNRTTNSNDLLSSLCLPFWMFM